MLPSFCRRTLTFQRAGVKSVRGASVEDWDRPTSHVVERCSVQPVNAARSGSDDRVAPAEADMAVYAPPGADMEVGDRVEYDGKKWRVVGVPLPWESPTGAVSHTVAYLARWEG